jgi:hypothetical protein
VVLQDGAAPPAYDGAGGDETMSEATAPKTYVGSCHCGNVRYEVTTDLSKVMECNGSIGSRFGYGRSL